MKLIVGLGNPGAKYRNTRHNFGFTVVDALAVDLGLSWQGSEDWNCFFAKNEEVVTIKPTIFMNVSGQAVSAVSNFYKIENKDILVAHDDLDIDFGKIRMGFDGSAGGHHGVESVIEDLAGMDFARLRLGIKPPEKAAGFDGVNYVLGKFTAEEQKELPKTIDCGVDAIKSYLAEGVMATMNRYN